MKKLVLFSLALTFGVLTAHSQNRFQAGGHLGLPVGITSDISDFAITVDLAYMFEVGDKFSAGPTLGYSHSFGNDIKAGIFGTIEIEDIQFLPIGGRAQFDITDRLLAKAELGYGIGINDGNDGGFYWSPQLGYGVSELIDIVLAYRSVSREGVSWSMITLGASFSIH